MPDLEERVSGMETRLTQIETEIPHLKESLDRNTKSNEKMTDVLNSLEKTFKIEVYYNGELLDDDSVVTSATIESKVLELTQNNEFILNSQNEGILNISKLTDNFYILNSIGVSKNLQSLIINASSNNPQFNKTISIDIKAVSMLG